MPMQQQPFLEIIAAGFAAGEVKTYALTGGYFELLDCVYPVTVRLIGLNGELKGIMSNAEASFYLKGGDFQTITIESPQAQSVRFAYGTSEAGTRRTAGIVQVVDGSRAIVESGVGFVGYATSPAVVGNMSQIQLWNPGGSGKKLVVKSLFLTAEAARIYTVRYHNAALGVVSTFSPPKCKLIGSLAPTVAETRHRNTTAAVDGTLIGPVIYVMANDSKSFHFNEPLIVLPGFGLNLACSTANESCHGTFDYYEVTI